MPLLRILLIVVAVWLIVTIIKRLYFSSNNKLHKKPPTPKVEQMVRCHKCSLHLPKSEAIKHNDRYYCCEEHRDDRTE